MTRPILSLKSKIIKEDSEMFPKVNVVDESKLWNMLDVQTALAVARNLHTGPYQAEGVRNAAMRLLSLAQPKVKSGILFPIINAQDPLAVLHAAFKDPMLDPVSFN